MDTYEIIDEILEFLRLRERFYRGEDAALDGAVEKYKLLLNHIKDEKRLEILKTHILQMASIAIERRAFTAPNPVCLFVELSDKEDSTPDPDHGF